MLSTETRLVTLAKKEEGLSIIITLILSIGGLLIALVITDIDSTRFSVILSVLYIKAAFTAVNIRFLSTSFLVILVITEFLSHMKTTSAIRGPGLSGIGLLVVIIAGFPAAKVISIGLGARFLVVLIILLNTVFLLLVKVTFIDKKAITRAKPLIPLLLNIIVFLGLNQIIIKVML
jgi:hypothetical protein